MTAACRTCGEAFQPTEYQARTSNWQCLPCRRMADKAWRAKRAAEGRPVRSTEMPLEYHREYNAAYYAREDVRAKRAEEARRRRIDPAEQPKLVARMAVRNALRRGELRKGACFCGTTRVDAHHEDYARPLDVTWLCRTHHVETHYAKAEGR